MNKQEFLEALRQALSGLPEEERQNALQYYEDYFADAGEENEAQAIADLGSPEAVAQAIVNDYRGLAAAPGGASSGASSVPAQRPARKKGLNPWVLLVIVLLAIPLGVPLLTAAIGLIAGFFGVVLALALIVVLVPVICGAVGIAVCWAGALALFTAPASAAVAIGGGLVCIAVGLLIGALFVKLLTLFVPPVVRGFVNLCRRPFERRGRS